MNLHQFQDMRIMYEAVYDDKLRGLADEYNNTVYDEDIVEVATEYFYTYGLNDDGIDILIEKVGLDNFVEFVYDLSEDLILTEARKVSKAKKQPGSLLSRQQKKLAAQIAAAKRTETEPESNGADTEAKAEQPKSKKPVRDAIARRILAGMERHREATQTAGRLAGETGKTLGKIAYVTREAGRRAGEHVKKHGMKSLANSYEYDTFDTVLEYLVAEGYADTNESALVIMANMSEEWRQSIVEGPGGMMMSAALRGKGLIVKTQPERGPRPSQSGSVMGPKPVDRSRLQPPPGATVNRYGSDGKKYTHIQK